MLPSTQMTLQPCRSCSFGIVYSRRHLSLRLHAAPASSIVLSYSQRYVDRKMDCNLHTGVYPPLTVAGGHPLHLAVMLARVNIAAQLPAAKLKCAEFSSKAAQTSTIRFSSSFAAASQSKVDRCSGAGIQRLHPGAVRVLSENQRLHAEFSGRLRMRRVPRNHAH